MLPALNNGFLPSFNNLCREFAAHLMMLAIISSLLVSATVYSQTAASLDAAKQKKILIVGDSLSAAYKLSREEGWPYLLQARLQEQGFDYLVINASVSGATTAAGLQIMSKSLDEYEPQIVVIELGGNDGLQGKPVAYIKENLKKLISMAQKGDAEVILTGIRLPPNFGARYTEPFFQQYAELAKQYDLILLPFLLEGVIGREGFMLEDGIHPSAIGQPVLLDNIWSVLQPLLTRELSAKPDS